MGISKACNCEGLGIVQYNVARRLSEITIFDHFDHKMWWSRGALIAIDGCGNSISDRLLAVPLEGWCNKNG